jgi:hypothetical protein
VLAIASDTGERYLSMPVYTAPYLDAARTI